MKVKPGPEGRLVYQDESLALFAADCRDMQELPDNSINLVITDPPFNVYVDYGMDTDDHQQPEAYGAWTREWLQEVERVLQPGGQLFALLPYKWMKTWLPHFPEPWHTLAWVKTTPLYLAQEKTFIRGWEPIFWHVKGQKMPTTWHKAYTYEGDRDWFIGPNAVGETRRVGWKQDHPTPRPDWLYERLIQKCSNPGDVVLDPFFGTGTGGAAARKLGRRFIGYDIKREYVEAAALHLSQQAFPTDWMELAEPVEKEEPQLRWEELWKPL